MWARFWTAVACAWLLAAPPAAADWLQEGHDAARTGFTSDAGPDWPDVAFVVDLPARQDASSIVSPLVVGHKAYIRQNNVTQEAAVTADPLFNPLQTETTIWEVDLDAGTARPFLHTPQRIHAMVSDGTRFYVLVARDVVAYDGAGSELWRLDLLSGASAALPGGSKDTEYGQFACAHPALQGHLLVAACTSYVGQGPGLFAVVVDVEARTVSAPLVREAQTEPPDPARPADAQTAVDEAIAAVDGTEPSGIQVVGVTLLGDVAVVTWASGAGFRLGSEEQDAWGYEYWGIDVPTRTSLWTRGLPASWNTARRVLDSGDSGLATVFPSLPTGDAGHMMFEWYDYLAAADPRAQTTVLSGPVIRHPPQDGDLGSGLAFDGNDTFVATANSLFSFDARLRLRWQYDLPAGETWAPGGLGIAGGRVYAQSQNTAFDGSLYCLDASNGRLAWRADFDSYVIWAISDGLVLARDTDSGDGLLRLHVLGRTAASLQPAVEASTSYPEPGEEVEVTVGGQPGAFGPATRWRADWGDGTATEWQATPTFRHRYKEPVDVAARFSAGNDRNQTASVPLTFFVGRDPGYFANVLSAKYQNLNFFLLGLAATALGAGLGVGRLRRRRNRLARELAAIDAAYQEAGGPARQEAVLWERRAHAKRLYAERRIDEGQLGVLEKHLDEIGRRARLADLDGRFAFLPHGMVRHLESILADGNVTAWERGHFLEALERDHLMTAGQKAKVRHLVDAWFAEDTR